MLEVEEDPLSSKMLEKGKSLLDLALAAVPLNALRDVLEPSVLDVVSVFGNT